MKPTQRPLRCSSSRTLRRSLLPLLAATFGLATSAPAADWYLALNQPSSGHDWHTVADWVPNADGTGTAAGSISATDTYDLNNHQLRTAGGASNVTFGGGLLRMTGGSAVLGLKTGGTATAIVPKLSSSGGSIENWGSGTQYFQATEYENVSGFTTLRAITGRGLKVTVGKLTGGGEIRLQGGGTLLLNFTDAERYAGPVHLVTGIVNFENDLSSAGSLVVDTGTQVILDQSVTFTGLSVAGLDYAVGTYSYATLQTAHPAIFTSGTGAGQIIVRPPRTWYLTTNQAGTQNWTEAYLANWNSAANGTGVAPTSLNVFDTYLNQAANRELRTLGTASTFGGGVLALTNGSKLTVKTGAGVVSTIPAFVNSASPIITNGGGNFRQNLAVGDWEITSGVTKLAASAGRGLGFAVDRLGGTGGLQTQSGGAFYLSLNDGSDYTGTLDHASGSLSFENYFSTQGAFNVGASATVTLDQHVYFTGFTVNGVTKAAGFHTYADLHTAHPAQFPSGSATGLVGVYTADPAGPARLFGVNISGPESTGGAGTPFPGTYGSQWVYPTVADFDYYQAKGLNLIRLPFRWERMQTSLNSALDSAELARMDTAVSRAAARGMKIILDMHNYAEYRMAGVSPTPKLGTASLPVSAFADVWRRLADHYKNETAIYGYDIMNEPNGLGGGVWVTAAQGAINAIREVDLKTYVIVEGEFWANAWGFESKNPSLHTVRDPIDRLIFSAHSYWCKAGSDQYLSYDAENGYPLKGVDNVKPFVEWLKKYNLRGFVGEYGVPNSDSRWLVVLDNFLTYLESEGVSGTYWAGGGWLAGSQISCHPSSNYTVDRPVMSVIEDHP